MKDAFYISTDKSKLNLELIHKFLSNDSYWAIGRTLETVQTSIQHALCFGVYKADEQVGFARVVTDYSVFAWILDVFILKDYRKKGLGKMLMGAIMTHPALQKMQRWGLATNDAHGLYETYGFQRIKRPEVFMEIFARPS